MSSSATINVKINHQGQIRRLTLEKGPNMYHTLMEQIFAQYDLGKQVHPLFSLQYYDEDKDLIPVSSYNELLAAINVQMEIMGQRAVYLIFKAPSAENVEIENSVEQKRDDTPQENSSLVQLDASELSTPVLSSVDSPFEEDVSSSKRKGKELSRISRMASKSIVINFKENRWPSHVTNLIIDAESMLVSTKAMNRLTKSEECTLAAGKILAKLFAQFHHEMKDQPLLQTCILFNDQKLASLVEESLKQNSSLHHANIQVISGGEELLPKVVEELKTKGVFQSTLIATDNKNLLKSMKDTEAVCISSKPMIKFMFSTIDQVQNSASFNFFAWVNQECARHGVSPAKCKRHHCVL